MPVFPVTHFQWQVLRAVKRSRKPLPGKALRLSPTRGTKDGSFLNTLVALGLLVRDGGGDKNPFDATYSLSELGKHAAEYGECEFPAAEPILAAQPRKNSKKK